MLNFEHSVGRPGQFKGTAAILQKLQSLPQQVKHQVITIDCQPTPGGGSVGDDLRQSSRRHRNSPEI